MNSLAMSEDFLPTKYLGIMLFRDMGNSLRTQPLVLRDAQIREAVLCIKVEL